MSNSHTATEKSNTQRICELRDLVLTEIEPAFAEFITLLPEKFLAYAEKPGTNKTIISYLHAQTLFTAHQGVMTERFHREIAKAFHSLEMETSTTSPDNWKESTLSLVSHEDIEEEVALSAIKSRAENNYSQQLWALRQRISLLNGGKKLADNQLPLSPATFCLGFRRALAGYEIDMEAKLIAFKLFEKTFIATLGNLYDKTNQHLLEGGLLPNLHYTVTNKQSPSPPARQASTLTLETIKELLRQLDHTPTQTNIARESTGAKKPDNSATSADDGTARTGYNEQQLVEAAHHLQQHSALLLHNDIPVIAIKPLDIAAARNQLTARLQQITESSEQPALSSDDMKTIELVGMLFEYMLNDEQLPDVIKALLSHLHTPFIKVALINKGFFEHKDHPARLLMNNLADAGVKWVGNDGKGQYGVLETIRSNVRQIVDDFDKDSQLFARSLMEFSGYIKKVDIKVQLLEKRAAEKARGEDKLKQVKQRVNTEIKQRIADVELPSALLLLFLQPWSDYMAFLFLRYGEKSEHWHQALSLIDDLIWGLGLDDTPENRQSWRQNYTWVETTIAKGFETIGYNPGKAAKLKSAIDKVYEFSYRSSRTNTPDELRQKLINLADQRAGDSIDIDTLEAGEKQIIKELIQLQFGTWFEYTDGHREKLAWYNKSSLQFLFVDQSGRRTDMKNGTDLAQKILSGELIVINNQNQPLVERTLANIYTDLSSQVASHGT